MQDYNGWFDVNTWIIYLNKVCIVIIEWVPTILAGCGRFVVLHSRRRLWGPRRCHWQRMRQNIRCSEFILCKQLHGIMQTLPASPAERIVEYHNVCNHKTYWYAWNPLFSLPILVTHCTTSNAVAQKSLLKDSNCDFQPNDAYTLSGCDHAKL